METKHTPGPWVVLRVPSVTQINRQNGQTIAITQRDSWQTDDEEKANAHLIAAAPDMLAALETARKIIDVARGYFPKSIRNTDAFALNLAAAEIGTGIAKAKGEA